MPIDAINLPGAKSVFLDLSSFWADADDVNFEDGLVILARIKAGGAATETLVIDGAPDYQGRDTAAGHGIATVTKANGMALFGPFPSESYRSAGNLLLITPAESPTDIEIIAVRNFFKTFI